MQQNGTDLSAVRIPHLAMPGVAALEPAWTAEVECRLSDNSRLIAFLLQQSHGIQ